MVQSIVAEIGNEKHMTQMRARPASMTSDSDVKSERNWCPNSRNSPPSTAAATAE